MSNPPSLRVPGDKIVLESSDVTRLQTALGVLLRRAVTESSGLEDCAARCGVSIADLRRVSYLTRVPLLFGLGGER